MALAYKGFASNGNRVDIIAKLPAGCNIVHYYLHAL